MSEFIVVEKTARNCGGWGGYVKIAVVEIEDGFGAPSMISERARGVIRVVEEWDRCYRGKTDRCAAAIVRRAAEALVERLNNPLDRIVMELDAA